MGLMRAGWLFKIILPITAVLVCGIIALVWLGLSREGPERQTVLLVGLGIAALICAAVLLATVIAVQQALSELEGKITQIRDGNLDVAVGFAEGSGELARLGRSFNEMARQLQESRRLLEQVHASQMSRAEHLATLGELAAGLAHEIRNPLAGITGVIELIGSELP